MRDPFRGVVEVFEYRGCLGFTQSQFLFVCNTRKYSSVEGPLEDTSPFRTIPIPNQQRGLLLTSRYLTQTDTNSVEPHNGYLYPPPTTPEAPVLKRQHPLARSAPCPRPYSWECPTRLSNNKVTKATVWHNARREYSCDFCYNCLSTSCEGFNQQRAQHQEPPSKERLVLAWRGYNK